MVRIRGSQQRDSDGTVKAKIIPMHEMELKIRDYLTKYERTHAASKIVELFKENMNNFLTILMEDQMDTRTTITIMELKQKLK